jgi:hypothetical protein
MSYDCQFFCNARDNRARMLNLNELTTGTRRFPLQFVLLMTLLSPDVRLSWSTFIPQLRTNIVFDKTGLLILALPTGIEDFSPRSRSLKDHLCLVD